MIISGGNMIISGGNMIISGGKMTISGGKMTISGAPKNRFPFFNYFKNLTQSHLVNLNKLIQ